MLQWNHYSKRAQSRIAHCISSPCHSSPYWSGKLSLVCPCLSQPWHFWRVVILSHGFQLEFVCGFLVIRLRLCIFSRTVPGSDVVFLIHPDISGRTHFHLSQGSLGHLIKGISVRLFHIPVTLSPFVVNQSFFLFLIYIYLFIWLHWVLVVVRGIFVAAHEGSSLRHAGSLVAACGIWFPDQGSNLGPLHWERGVLATGPPGKSLNQYFLRRYFETM